MSSKTRILRHGTTIDILVLEDDAQLAAMLKDVLESCSFRVTTVQNGVQGLRCIMDQEFDLVLCDMVMPTFPGDKFYIAVER
jgi:two-component system, NtrC family, nitrogen regulation response regulator NtrX